MMDFVAFDFETATRHRHSACSMGLARVRNGNIAETKAWMIRPPEMLFDEMNIHIHGIRPEDVQNSPDLEEIWPQIHEFIGENVVIAHWASFDISVLKNSLGFYGVDWPDLRYLCSWQLSKRTIPKKQNYRLDTMANHFGIEFKHHDATEDAVACAKIVLEIAKISECSSLDDLVKKLAIHYGELTQGKHRSSQLIKKDYLTDEERTVTVFSDILFDTSFVFTGTLNSMKRKEAWDLIEGNGGHWSKGITMKTDYLVLGLQDFKRFADGKRSSKHKKALDMIQNGHRIEIISEEDFLAMLDS